MRKPLTVIILSLFMIAFSHQGAFANKLSSEISRTTGSVSYGKASHYGGYKLTASGENFSAASLTAAHKTLPFGSIVRVENVKSGKEVIVKFNNRGPFIKGRHLDLTTTAFSKIAPLKQGVVNVKYEVISIGDNKYRRSKSK